MSDEAAKKPDWAITFLLRLCIFSWVCAILYESFDFFKPIRQPCLLFGFWSSILALLNANIMLFIRRQGVFLLFVLVAIPPSVHFSLVVRNIMVQKNWIDPAVFGGGTGVESTESVGTIEPTTTTNEPASSTEKSTP